MQPKVLIGCVTFKGQEYCLKEFLEGLRKISFKDVLFVDNSEDDSYGEILKQEGFEVIRDRVESDFYLDKILSGRKIIRQKMLEGDYDYLFFLDTDIVSPPDIIEKLLSHNKDLITGVYIGRREIEGKSYKVPILYGLVEQDKSARLTGVDEVIGDKVFEIAAAGFGCCLIHRKVLEKIDIRYYQDTKRGEDIAFFEDARALGFKAFVDTSVKCKHMAKDKTMEVPDRL